MKINATNIYSEIIKLGVKGGYITPLESFTGTGMSKDEISNI